VKVMRRATTAVALSVGLFAPLSAEAQRPGQGPGPDTPKLLVSVFTSRELALGVQVADAIRSRLGNTANPRSLYIIPKQDLVTYLESSGYRPDSALGTSDLRELGRLLRADEIVGGIVTRTATGIRVEPRLMIARDPALAQPLPAIEAENPNAVARAIEKTVNDARKQLADNRACENGIRDSKWDAATAAARAGIAKYPDATIARLCLANVFQAMKADPDSVLKVTDEIRRIDPRNSMALRFAYAAYQAKNDNENAVRALVGLLALEPQNMTLQQQVVTALAQLGKPEVALPIVDTLIAQNPGDPQLQRQKWLLLLNAAASADTGEAKRRYFDRAVEAGEVLVRNDTMLADTNYFSRQIAAATSGSQPARAIEMASRAVQKYPTSAEFWFLKGNAERKAGQLQMADESLRRAFTLNPKYPALDLLLTQTNLELGRMDTVVAMVRRNVAAGGDAKTWAGFLLAPAQAAWKIADSTKKQEDYERVLALAQESDKLSMTPTAAFFVGISSFSIAMEALQAAQKPKSCALARKAQDMFLLTQTNMPRGGSIDANTARTVLGYVTQYAPTAEQMVKAYCK
jgi:tetratricopeptide (TPR) repeat protein